MFLEVVIVQNLKKDLLIDFKNYDLVWNTQIVLLLIFSVGVYFS